MKVAFHIITTLLISCTALAQSQGTPYVFEMKEGQEVIYGLVNPDRLDRRRFIVTIEEPWNRSVTTRELRKSAIEDLFPEMTNTYNQRIKTEWESRGGEEVETLSGKKWMLKTELELARRSLAVPAIITEVTPIGDPSGTLASPAVTASSGGILQWWLHGLIALIGTALAGLILWWGFLKKDWSTSL